MHVVRKSCSIARSRAKAVSVVQAALSSSIWRQGKREVGMFSSKINPVTGKMEWVAQDRDVTSEEGDLSHELARSQYGDMLHDTIRNQLYCQAIEKAVSAVRSKGKAPHVLDIGTGTGLLSMMAARAGATRVTAVEVLRPMVRIAREVIAANGYSDIITVVPKRSTDMTEADMEGGRANILVTEVFDTELIGEGALLTYSHALTNLTEPDCIVIPDSVTVYVQLLKSDFLWRHHKLVPERLPVGVKVPVGWRECSGAPSLWDLHAEQLEIPQQMTMLSEPTEVARFTLSDPAVSSDHSIPEVMVPVSEHGICHAVLMWWNADMSGAELSMSPWQYIQWRDHWLQAVQFLPEPLTINKGDRVRVECRHDDYSMWFHDSPHDSPPSLPLSPETTPPSPEIPPLSPGTPPPSPERPVCTCGMHTAWSRARIAMHNDTTRTQLYLSALSQAISGKSRVVCVSDGSLLPLLLLLTHTKAFSSLTTVYSLETNPYSARVVKELLENNPLPPNKAVRVLTKVPSQLSVDDLTNETTPTGTAGEGALIEAVIGEPYFSTSLLPWHNLHFWYASDAVRHMCTPDCVTVPSSADLMAIAVCFEDLYNLRAPVGTVEGFDITAFDKRVGKVASDDEWVEPEMHPLWEYPSYPCSEVHTLVTFDLTSPVPSAPIRMSGTMELAKQLSTVTDSNGVRDRGREGGSECVGGIRRCNAVVLWMEYQLSDKHRSTTGLTKPPRHATEKLSWDYNSKQAVHFLPPNYIHSQTDMSRLNYGLEFNTASGELRFSFTAS